MSKVMGIYVKFYNDHSQIWSCYVTLVANLKRFHFSPRSAPNFGRSYRIWGKLAPAGFPGPFSGGFFVGVLSTGLSVFGP